MSEVAEVKSQATKATPFVKATVLQVRTALQRVLGTVERKSKLPVLSNVLIAVKEGRVTLQTSDLNGHMHTGASGGVPGANVRTTINAHTLNDILRTLSDELVVSLAVQANGKVVLQAGKSRFTLATLPADDFPVPNPGEFATALIVPATQLHGLLKQTSYAMANGDIRTYLNGMLLEVDGKAVTAVATDGSRLAASKTELEGDAPSHSVILPRKTVVELQRLLDGSKEEVHVSLSPTHAKFVFGGVELTSQLVSGKYPDYTRVLPKANNIEVTFDRAELVASVNRSALMCSGKFKGINVELSTDNVTLSATNTEQEAVQDSIGIEYQGQPIKFAFNVDLLSGALNNIEADTVTLKFSENSMAACQIVDPDNTGLSVVVMPMRL